MLLQRKAIPLWLSLAFGAATAQIAPTAAQADIARLKNGGQLRGEVEPSDDDGPEIELRTLTGGRVVIDRQHLVVVTQRRKVIEIYETKAKSAADTVDAQWALAEWCRDNHLNAQRRVHLQNVVRLDVNHEKAHRLLGQVLRNGEWVDKDEALLKRGYVRHNGEIVTLQEREMLEQQDEQREVEKDWHKKVRKWYAWANGRNPQKRTEGVGELQRVQDPDAIPALSYFLQDNRDVGWREFFVNTLAKIPGDRPVNVLAALSLFDSDAGIRSAAFEAIGKERQGLAVGYYVAELQNGLNVIVCRAGTALGKIGDEQVIPALIEALVTTHSYKVRVPTSEGSYTFGTNGSIGASDAALPPSVEAALRTGQYPNGVIVVQPNKYVHTKVVTVRRDHQNSEVLAALNKLTGESFAYDENAWRIWWTARKNQPAG